MSAFEGKLDLFFLHPAHLNKRNGLPSLLIKKIGDGYIYPIQQKYF
tara:strand:+ start:4414 stop:4551 length:138 start_codon:yes stop_codon:yes gene_type:complete